jgi:hypothetical protein
MRNRARILENLESIYRESYERARTEGLPARMVELDNAYMRDQLMLEILLDIRDLFLRGPGREGSRGPRYAGTSAATGWQVSGYPVTA